MSFSGGRTPLYTSSLAMLLIILLLHIWISGQTTVVEAIRTFPQRPTAAAEEERGRIMDAAAAPPGKSQTQIFREYFDSRLSDINSTTNGTYADFKRIIPSCPDPLHN